VRPETSVGPWAQYHLPVSEEPAKENLRLEGLPRVPIETCGNLRPVERGRSRDGGEDPRRGFRLRLLLLELAKLMLCLRNRRLKFVVSQILIAFAQPLSGR